MHRIAHPIPPFKQRFLRLSPNHYRWGRNLQVELESTVPCDECGEIYLFQLKNGVSKPITLTY